MESDSIKQQIHGQCVFLWNVFGEMFPISRLSIIFARFAALFVSKTSWCWCFWIHWNEATCDFDLSTKLDHLKTLITSDKGSTRANHQSNVSDLAHTILIYICVFAEMIKIFHWSSVQSRTPIYKYTYLTCSILILGRFLWQTEVLRCSQVSDSRCSKGDSSGWWWTRVRVLSVILGDGELMGHEWSVDTKSQTQFGVLRQVNWAADWMSSAPIPTSRRGGW